MSPYDDMPRSWVHPNTMAAIRLVVGSVLIALAGFFLVLGLAL